MSGHFLDNDRLSDLLVQQAIEGLSAADEVELQELLAAYPDANPQAIESTAAAVLLAGNWKEEPLPEAARLRLEAAAAGFCAANTIVELPKASPRAPDVGKGRSVSSGFAWFAAAASIVLAVIAWLPRQQQQVELDLVTQASPDAETLAARRQTLLAAARPLVREWSSTDDPAGAGVQGDVVWDAASQTGYMRFTGLPANDPGALQYQLWIFDEARDDRYPVDGGVFDIPSDGGEVVIPILAKLPVTSPKLFAVTIERPGGVVVSSRERIVVVAAVSAG